MGLFSWFKPQTGGLMAYHGLAEWWEVTFTSDEISTIVGRYQPLGSSSHLIKGRINSSSESAIGFLAGLASWFEKPEHTHLAMRMLDKATAVAGQGDALDLHFLYLAAIKVYYRNREASGMLDKAIEACQQQIACAPKAAPAFKKMWGGDLPSHTGYKQLAIIYDKQKKHQEAIDLCRQALEQGWAGDWEKRIVRYEKKLDRK